MVVRIDLDTKDWIPLTTNGTTLNIQQLSSKPVMIQVSNSNESPEEDIGYIVTGRIRTDMFINNYQYIWVKALHGRATLVVDGYDVSPEEWDIEIINGNIVIHNMETPTQSDISLDNNSIIVG